MVTCKKPTEDTPPWDDKKAAKKVAAKKVAAKKVVAPKAAEAAKGKPTASSEAEKKPLGPPPAGLKVPKNLGEGADAYKTARDLQAAKKKEMDVEEEKAKWLKAWLLENLPKAGQNVAGGKVAKVEIKNKETPRVEDWSPVYKRIVADYLLHVKKKTGQEDGAFALLQRRIGEAAVNAIWDAGGTLAGVSKFKYLDLSVTQVV